MEQKEITILDVLKENRRCKILQSEFGYEKGDIGIIIRKCQGGYLVFVPDRKSTSARYPNVWFYEHAIEIQSIDNDLK